MPGFVCCTIHTFTLFPTADRRHRDANTRRKSRGRVHTDRQKLPLQDPQCGFRLVSICVAMWCDASLEPRGVRVHTSQNQQSKDDLFGLIYIAASAAAGRWAQGVTSPWSHGRKAAFPSLCPNVCMRMRLCKITQWSWHPWACVTSPSVHCPAPSRRSYRERTANPWPFRYI